MMMCRAIDGAAHIISDVSCGGALFPFENPDREQDRQGDAEDERSGGTDEKRRVSSGVYGIGDKGGASREPP
jgi:hypothetical protein